MNTQRTHNLLALILLIACLFAAGCTGRTPGGAPTHSAPPARLHCYLGLDASQSARPHLGRYTLLSGQIASRLNADTDRLTLFRLDDHVTEFSDKPATGSMEATLTAITQNVQQVSPGHGTFPAKFWEEIAQRAAQSEDAVVILFTDGDNDDQRAASEKAIRSAAARLAKNPHVKAVILCGVERRNYASLHTAFAPLGEHRFRLLNPQEMEMDTLATYLQEARSQSDDALSTDRTTQARR
jgi:hypothetical protein